MHYPMEALEQWSQFSPEPINKGCWAQECLFALILVLNTELIYNST